jgi:cytochrome P450
MADIYQRKTAPGPPGILLLGSIPAVKHDRIRFLMDAIHEHGDIVRFRMGPQTFHIVNHPDHIKHVLQRNHQNYHKGIGLSHAKSLLGEGLLTSEDEMWVRQRRLIQPVFHHHQIERFATTMATATAEMLDRWRFYIESGEPLDISDEMMRLTLVILGRTLLGSDISSDADVIGRAVTVALEQAIYRMTAPINLPETLPTPSNLRFRKAVRTLDNFVYKLVEDRRNGKRNQDDLLTMLLLACDDQAVNGMSDQQLRDEVMTILLAGHETTAVALGWTWYLLSKNSGVQRQLQDELATVLAGRIPTTQDFPLLKYTKMVIEESMRLYPPVWLIPRKAIEDDEIGGYHIPARSGVLISPYAIHRHPAFWKDAEEFNPERFRDKGDKNQRSYIYFPFGAGPRHCIGSHFAMMEMQLVLSIVAQKYRLHLANNDSTEIEPLLTLRPRHGISMTVHTV